MNIRRMIATTLCAAVCVSGCAGKPQNNAGGQENTTNTAQTSDEKEVKEYQAKLDMIELAAYRDVSGINMEAGAYLSVIGASEDGAYWEEIEEGAKQAVRDINENLRYIGEDEVRVVYSAPEESGSVDEQVNILDEELARYPVALAIAVADSRACGVQFDLAAESGIPIVAFESGADYAGVMAMVSTDNRTTAAEAADHMAESMGQTGEVLVLASGSGSRSARERVAGFTERLQAAYPGMTITEVYYADQAEEIKKQIAAEQQLESIDEIGEEEVMDRILSGHPDVKGIFATDGEGVMDAVDALERAAKKDVTVVGYDAEEEELEALRSGAVDGLIVQNPFGMGYAAVLAAARASLSMGNEAYVNTGAVWVTKANMDSSAVKNILY